MSWLVLRKEMLSEDFTAVDAASKATRTQLHDPLRARAEMCVLIVCAKKKSLPAHGSQR